MTSINLTELIGLIAATLTTLCFVPQAIRTLKTRETHSISKWMYVFFSCGLFCWLIYGILLGNTPMILANAITLPLALTILYVKLQEKKIIIKKEKR
ncbi:MAG: hypothetical protein K0R63_171 [Rickettsiales bacterium]|nr:hypothetical protein [Rickettsiales bacterium]